VQSSSQLITTNKPTSSFFYRLDALPVAQPTKPNQSKDCREIQKNELLSGNKPHKHDDGDDKRDDSKWMAGTKQTMVIE